MDLSASRILFVHLKHCGRTVVPTWCTKPQDGLAVCGTFISQCSKDQRYIDCPNPAKV